MTKTRERVRYWRTPVDFDRIGRTVGEVVILDQRCKGCAFCVEYCPRKVLALSDRFNRKGYHPPRVTRPGECINCNLCEMICPEFAIFSYAVPAITQSRATAPEVQR